VLRIHQRMNLRKTLRRSLATVAVAFCCTSPTAHTEDLPMNSDLVIPVVARSSGLHGTVWSTRLEVLYPTCEIFYAEPVLVCFWPANTSNSAPQSCVYNDVPSCQTLVYDDLLLEAFGMESGSGFVTIRGNVFAQAVIKNSISGGGSYGQYVPAVPPTWSFPLTEQPEVKAVTTQAYFFAVAENEEHRSNLGIVNLSSEHLRFDVFVFYGDIHPRWQFELDVQPNSMTQFHRFLSPVCSTGSCEFPMVVVSQNDEPHGQYLAYISRVNNVTGDAVFIPAHSNLLALVPPGGNEQPQPNPGVPADRDPRERGSRPLNTNR